MLLNIDEKIAIEPGTKAGPLITLSLIPGTKPGLFYYNDL